MVRLDDHFLVSHFSFLISVFLLLVQPNGTAGVILHVTVIATKVQVIYGTVHLDWKLQNNREKCSMSRKKLFHRILIVGNLENLAKNRQVGIICRINVKRKQETGNKQTDRQPEYCNRGVARGTERQEFFFYI